MVVLKLDSLILLGGDDYTNPLTEKYLNMIKHN